ncbi:MAG: hypothetical protein VXZ18_19160 [Pseudomonadota bacterium]|nr:hypothetical protein [Pseudomonadota bacterium]
MKIKLNDDEDDDDDDDDDDSLSCAGSSTPFDFLCNLSGLKEVLAYEKVPAIQPLVQHTSCQLVLTSGAIHWVGVRHSEV